MPNFWFEFPQWNIFLGKKKKKKKMLDPIQKNGLKVI